MTKTGLAHKTSDKPYGITSPPDGSAERIYDTLYCARGNAKNRIKRHKVQLASNRTSCRVTFELKPTPPKTCFRVARRATLPKPNP